MTDTTAKKDPLDWEEPKKLSDMLNVLTILTFIWNGLAILLTIYAFTSAQANYEKAVQMQAKSDEMPSFVKKFMGPDPVGNAQKFLDNRIPITLLSVIACALCLYGAIQMRQRKKMGFSLYIVGDLLPIATSAIFMGMASMTTTGSIFGLGLVGLFVILYATQLKYMS